MENQALVDLAVEVLKMSTENATNDFDTLALAMMWLEELLPEYYEDPPPSPPDVKRTTSKSNLGNYMYLEEAIYLMKARLRDKFINKGVGQLTDNI